MVAMGIISLWTPLAHPHIANRWFLPKPVLVSACSGISAVQLMGSSGLLTAAHFTPFSNADAGVSWFSGLGISICNYHSSIGFASQAAAPVMSPVVHAGR